jgi:hypothetical protein
MSEPAIYKSELGRIVRRPCHFDAWDWRGEYLGKFITVERALASMKEAQVIHQRLTNDYNNRKR